MSEFVLSDENYYSLEADRRYCSASQFLDAVGRPILPGCEARMMAKLNGEWQQETTKAMLVGSILDALWEGARGEELAARFPDCISTRGATKGELRAEFKQCLQLYERSYQDETFRKYMSGNKQSILTGEIEGLPFKIKMDSYIEGKAIVDLKTTSNASVDERKYIPDSGERLPFYMAWGYTTQLSIYREVVRQNTGDTLHCYIAAIDKKPHPLPQVIYLEPKLLDDALEDVKRNCEKIIRLKSGEIEPLRCEHDSCDYCRDTYKVKVISTSEFEAHDIQRGDI